MKVREDADLSGDTDIIVRALKQPSCLGVKVNNGIVSFDIEKELGVEIVGETKMKIAIEDDEEPWDEIYDDIDDEALKEIDESVNLEYLEEIKENN